jgi:hypothetical protein
MRGAFRTGDDRDLDGEAELRLWWGTVVSNQDPLKRGRCKIDVHGLTDHSTDWTYPMGMPGGTEAGQGAYFVPREGSLVLVGFVLGDFEEPFYIPGPWTAPKGADSAPKKVREQTVADAPNVRVLAQTESFEVYIAETSQETRLNIGSIEDFPQTVLSMNLDDGSIRLTASHFIIMEAPTISIKAENQVQIQDRVVNDATPKDI